MQDKVPMVVTEATSLENVKSCNGTILGVLDIYSISRGNVYGYSKIYSKIN